MPNARPSLAARTPIPRLRAYDGPAVLSYGFRPFFLLGAAYAGLAVLTWLPLFYGELRLFTAMSPVDWHVHEMLYGYLAAVTTGFLLTAVPNWTGRLPLQGGPLLVLVLAWLAGRIAVTMSAVIGWRAAALIDVAFPALVLAAAAREILSGRNWRNLKILAVLLLFAIGNAVFHVEAHLGGKAAYGQRLGIAAAIGLVMLVGGRIVPSFTRNWLARENPGRLPAPLGRFDVLSLAVGGAALVSWVIAPELRLTGVALVAGGLMQAARMARWAGDRTLRDPLVLILHVGYAFVPLGFLLLGAAVLAPDRMPASAGIHAWTAGAVGVMALAVMTRATLGHTGRDLRASPATLAIYGAAIVAVLSRICAALEPEWSFALLHVAAFAWAAAFLGFAAAYGPMLLGPAMRPGLAAPP